MAQAEVRAYDVRDRDELVALFGAAGAGAPAAEAWGHEQSLAEVYLTPYLDLVPESVFVAVVDGRLAGYLAGCVDETDVPTEEQRTEDAVRRHHLWLRPGPARFLLRARWDMLLCRLRGIPTAQELDDPRWPAHLHIDLLPIARGTGAAYGLMGLWFEHLRAVGSPGCHLHTSAENVHGVRFFERAGFAKHGPNPVVPGLRHEGRHMHQQTMVWSA